MLQIWLNLTRFTIEPVLQSSRHICLTVYLFISQVEKNTLPFGGSGNCLLHLNDVWHNKFTAPPFGPGCTQHRVPSNHGEENSWAFQDLSSIFHDLIWVSVAMMFSTFSAEDIHTNHVFHSSFEVFLVSVWIMCNCVVYQWLELSH